MSDHHHHHGHHHGHDHHQQNFAKVNEATFDEVGPKMDSSPLVLEYAQRNVAGLRKFHDFNESTTVLDFACGTGVLARELLPHVKSIVGVDISQGVVDQLNTRTVELNIPHSQLRAVRAELKGVDRELDDQKFDVVLCCMAYHHFDSPEAITKTLAHFLKPGGALLVLDFLDDGTGSRGAHTHHGHGHEHEHGHGHGHGHDSHQCGSDTNTSHHAHGEGGNQAAAQKVLETIAHHGGFTEEQVRGLFEVAGLKSFAFNSDLVRLKNFVTLEEGMVAFIAKGFKAE